MTIQPIDLLHVSIVKPVNKTNLKGTLIIFPRSPSSIRLRLLPSSQTSSSPSPVPHPHSHLLFLILSLALDLRSSPKTRVSKDLGFGDPSLSVALCPRSCLPSAAMKRPPSSDSSAQPRRLSSPVRILISSSPHLCSFRGFRSKD